jgi:HTH-type transcriptional regulator / antitoxin HigA
MPTTLKSNGKMTPGFEEEYAALCRDFPPRAITSRQQLKQREAIIDRLVDSPEKLSRAQREYLNTLGTLVFDYEEKHVPMPDLDPIDLLHQLIEDRGLRQKDLIPVFKTESIASAVLNRRRGLTRRHIEGLALFSMCLRPCWTGQEACPQPCQSHTTAIACRPIFACRS